MPDPVETKPKLSVLIIFLFAVLLAAIIPYSNSLKNDFVFDDITIIAENDLIQSMKNLPEIFSSDYWIQKSHERTGLYRPLTLLSFALNHRFSALNPFSYHLTNLLIHALNSILLFLLFVMLFKHMRAALLCSVVFAIHPIHTEAVTGIVGRAELLSFFFIFVSMIAFLAAGTIRTLRLRAFFLYLLSLLSFLLALLSKETALALAPALFFILIYREKKQNDRSVLSTLRNYRYEFVAVLLIVAFYLVLRMIIFGGPIGSSKPILLDNPLAHATLIERYLGASRVFFKYVWLLFFPLHLSADYSYNQIPLGGTSPIIVGGFSFLALLALVALAGFLYRKRSDFFVPLSLYFSAIFIVSNMFVMTGTIMAERLLYIPSAAFCIFLGMILSPDAGPLLKGKHSHAYFYLFLIFIAFFAIPRTLFRNVEWKNEETLFAATAEISSESAKAHNNYANILLEKGDFIRAEREIRMALKIYPGYSTACSNLGIIYERQELLDEALTLYKKAVQLDPDFEVAYSNLGNILSKKGDFRNAITAYRHAISIEPRYADAFYNLGNALALKNHFDGAVYHYKRALDISPDYIEAENNLGMVLKSLGKRKEAEAAFFRALKISPSFHNALYNLGKFYAEEARNSEAIQFLERAMQVRNDHFDTLFLLGYLLTRNGNLDSAYRILKKAEMLEPNNSNLKLLLREIERLRTER